MHHEGNYFTGLEKITVRLILGLGNMVKACLRVGCQFKLISLG